MVPSTTGCPERSANISLVLAKGRIGGLPAVRTVFDLGPMLRALSLHRRQFEHLPPLVGMGEHLLQRRPTGPTIRDGVQLAVIRLGYGLQRMALVAWLGAALFPIAGTEAAYARLLQTIAARGLAAVAAMFPQLGLDSVHPCLEVQVRAVNAPTKARTASSPCS
jgi:hypothetical protein